MDIPGGTTRRVTPHRTDQLRAAHRAVAVLAGSCLLGTALAGCGPFDRQQNGTAASARKPTGTVTVGIARPERLVPGDTVDPAGTQLLDALFTPMVTVRDGKVDMAAARSVTSDDAKVWTITLQDGYTFGNGRKVTAADYLRAWNFTAYGPNAQQGADLFSRIDGYDRMQSPGGGAKPRATTLAGVKQVGDATIRVTLTRPYGAFVNMLAAHAFDPLPAEAFTTDGTLATGFRTRPIGNGPYRLDGPVALATGADPGTATGPSDAASPSAVPGGTLRLTRVDGQTGRRPALDHLEFKIYSKPGDAYADLAAGRLDVLPQVPSADLGRAKADLGDRVQRTPSGYLAYLAVPSYVPALREPGLRKALSMAIDRPAVVKKIFLDTYRPATSWTSPAVPGGGTDGCGDTCRFDPAAAQRGYQEAGGLPGNKLEIFYNADGGLRKWVDEVCGQLKRNLDVTCAGKAVPPAELDKRADAKSLSGLVSDAWSPDFPSAADYLGPLYRTSGAHNDAHYSNPQLDKLLDQADAAPDAPEAASRYQAAEQVVATDLPTVPLWTRDTVSARSTRMGQLSVDPAGTVDLADLHIR